MSIYCLIGQSASGKTTIERRLEQMGFPRIISYTTRPIRDGEKNGIDYYFLDEGTFDKMNSEGKFAETAKYRGWKYGLSLENIDYKNEKYVAVVTVHGYKELLKAVGKEHIVSIHIKVDERERMLRLINRGDDVNEIVRRIRADRVDFKDVEEIADFIVRNDKGVDKSLVEVYNIINDRSAK